MDLDRDPAALPPTDFLQRSILPRAFRSNAPPAADDPYLRNPSALKLLEFFEAKGLLALKDEDRREHWYEDWLAYQREHRIYASVLSPQKYSSLGHRFDLLNLARLMELFGYSSPAHGYSLQCSFLGIFSIFMGTSDALKREAVAALEAGGLFAFGVSEKEHGADLLSNEFAIRENVPGKLVASGRKYYIGNSNAAAIISILARKEENGSRRNGRRAPFVLMALRPAQSPGLENLNKIRTLGVRAGHVGEFSVTDHPVAATDLIADNRQAWDAVIGTVTLGKFLLGFGAIGIAEHAFAEASAHLRSRLLYGRPVIELKHIDLLVAQSWARLAAMKLYAYRALDYVQAASASDRRYLLFAAVQKAKVSTEGVKVIAGLSECVGAKGFEADTFFEMALRDAALIPSLEGSTHINLTFAAQFIAQYFSTESSQEQQRPPSLIQRGTSPDENPYLMEARGNSLNTIAFPDFLTAYKPLLSIPNVSLFTRQIKAFNSFIRSDAQVASPPDTQVALLLGQCLAMIAYAQLIAENCVIFAIPAPIISAIFHLLVIDLSSSLSAVASLPHLSAPIRRNLRRLNLTPQLRPGDWDHVSRWAAA